MTARLAMHDQQLAFPGWRPSLECVHVETLHGDVNLKLMVRRGPCEVQLLLRVSTDHPAGDYWHRAAQREIRLRLDDDPSCTVDGEPTWWSMVDDDVPTGVFEDAIAWAVERIDSQGDEGDDEFRGESRFVPALRRVCHLTCGLAIAMCDARSRDRAVAFAPHVRLLVYAALVRDRRGRVAQIAEACPGLLILASCDERSGARTFAAIGEGRSRAELIRERLAHIAGTCTRDAAAIVRRAPARISLPTLVRTLRTPGIDVNDLPAGSEDALVWFDWQAAITIGARQLDPDRQKPFASFVSKHAVALEEMADRHAGDRAAFLSEIVDWACSPWGTVPTRRSNPERVAEDVLQWHISLWSGGPFSDAATLAPPPEPVEEIAAVELRPIRTAGALRAEGREMRHCAASFIPLAIEGRAFFYRGTVGRERVTVAIERSARGWQLREASGFGNRRPSAGTHGLTLRWIGTLEPR